MNRTIPRGAWPLLSFVRRTEVGRDDRASYDVIYGHKQDKLPKPLTSMTYGEIIDAQPRWSKNFGSSAAGGYQFMRATLIDLDKENPSISRSDVFTPDLQDQRGFALLLRRGYELFIAGKITRAEFGKRLAQEWASFPVLTATRGAHRDVPRGSSFYMGDKLNKALVSPEKVEAVLDQVKAAAGADLDEDKPAPVVVEKPVVADPGELGTPAAKSKTVWMWFLTAIGAPLAAFGNLDWRVQLVIVGVIVGFAVYGIKRRADLAKAVRDLKAEFA
jgi:muramidase (phage lysozyme)